MSYMTDAMDDVLFTLCSYLSAVLCDALNDILCKFHPCISPVQSLMVSEVMFRLEL